MKHIFRILPLLFALYAGVLSAAPHYSQAELNSKLFYAAKGGYLQTVKQLIEMGADVNATQNARETPLHAAAATGKLAVIQLLRQKGAKPNPRTQNGWIPLHHAARFGHVAVVNYLLATGAPLYLRTQNGKNVFDLATATKNKRMQQVLENWKRRKQHR